jgi:hypothetical protein
MTLLPEYAPPENTIAKSRPLVNGFAGNTGFAASVALAGPRGREYT